MSKLLPSRSRGANQSVGRATVIADDQAGDIDRLEVSQGQTFQTRQIVVIPAGIGPSGDWAFGTLVTVSTGEQLPN